MKKIYFLLSGLCLIFTASAQVSISVNGNYTMYKGDFKKSTPGAQVRVSYDFYEKMTGVIGFTYGMPINVSGTSYVMDQNGNTQEVASQMKYNFKTFHFLAHYTFVGDQETAGKFYGIAGAGIVLVSYKEAIT